MNTTREMRVYRDLPPETRSAILALSVLVDRIGALPKADRDDLFELLQAWRVAETEEERQSINAAMEEVLAQAPIVVLPLPDASVKSPREQPWCEHIGKKVREIRNEKGMSQQQLAEAAGLTQSHISRIENAEHRPNHFTLDKIARAFGLDVGQLDPCLDD